MYAIDFINKNVPIVNTNTTIADALSIMEELKVSDLPIVNGAELLGLLSESELLNHNNYNQTIGSIENICSNIFVEENTHIFDILKTINNNNLSLLPIASKNRIYKGSIITKDLVVNMADILSANNPGGIIVLEINVNDYSMSQISSIIESNDALIISFFVHNDESSTKMNVSIKVNKTDISGIIQTFNRYEYNVKASFGEDEMTDILIDRYQSLMNYLNI